jgi:GNAT superfamily N-acetyltransferase
MEKRIFVVRAERDLERCYPVMKELRPHLSYENFLSIYRQAHAQDAYEIVAIESGGEILALMGYRFLFDYVRGKHLYVDDLVSSEKMRSKGLGALLLRFAESAAKEADCATLRLCTGLENERGMSFYEREGWSKRSLAYTKKV